MISEKYNQYHFILGSKSPRRQHLLKELGLRFEIATIDLDEHYPSELKAENIARYLCGIKADAFNLELYPDNTVLITADTIVWLEGQCIGKPKDKTDAIRMLSLLSGKQHTVYSGICLMTKERKHIFHSATTVNFKKLQPEEIEYYIAHHRPYDKAGSYGIQDWIGYSGITGINGCYYNVMGFPVQRFSDELEAFLGGELKE
ncbi:MAG: septum formation protein Maf [Bacteroidetes bacterium]|nr:septum formation protein Maf [Bacteroidota bacterium]